MKRAADSERYDRNIRLFGIAGQEAIGRTTTCVVGVGGLGSALVQHLALLGVKEIKLVDDQELDDTNRNRFVGARDSDPVPGSAKVDLSARLVSEINTAVTPTPTKAQLVSKQGFAAVKSSDVIFGCLDHDGPRSILNELCAAYDKPYIDLASDVLEDGAYGGRVSVAWSGEGCLLCLGLLDNAAVRRYFSNEADLEFERKIYGVDRELLDATGPSVSPLNGVVAALAAMEFMVAVTTMRPPSVLLNYYAHLGGTVRRRAEPPEAGCFICKSVRGTQEAAAVERHLSGTPRASMEGRPGGEA